MLLAAAVLLASSCGRDKARVISRSKMSKIYAEMFVMDQWVQNKPGLRTIADTSLVYEPILEKYGFDSDDYQHSVEYYMADPERFSRILRSTVAILEKDLKALRKKQAEIMLNEKLKKEIENFEITMFQFYDEFVTEDGLRNLSDSVDVVWDTTYNAHRIRRMPRTDTVYEGPRMIVKDKIVANDTLAMVDSLAVADSLAMTDSLAVTDSLLKAKTAPILKGALGLHKDTLKTQINRQSKKQREPVRPRWPQNTASKKEN